MGQIMFASSTFDLHADTGGLTIWIGCGFLILSVVGIVLRFYSKRIVGQGFLIEDCLLGLAFLFSVGLYAVETYAVLHGNLGRHIILASPETIEHFLRAVYGVQITFAFSLALTKFSITMMYRRLFKVHNSSVQLLIFDVFSLLRLVATVLAFIFSCSPVKAFWDKSIPGKCQVNVHDVYVFNSAMNIITDLAILYFPLPIIWSLQLYRAQKLSVYAFFVCAGSITLISVVRLVSLIQSGGSDDLTWVLQPVVVWTTAEVSAAIFCACIPSMRPLLQLIPGRKHGTPIIDSPSNLQLHHNNRWWGKLGPNIHENAANFMRMKGGIEEPFELYGPRTLITANNGDPESAPEAQEGIHVQREVRIEEEVIVEHDANVEQEVSWR